MGIYDQCMAMLQLGKDADKELMATSLMTAFNDFKVALPLDSVKQTNKDGSFKLDKKTGLPKIKTEYSKDIAGILVGHHVDFNRVGSDLYNLKKYKEAYDAWGAYLELPTMGIAEKISSTRWLWLTLQCRLSHSIAVSPLGRLKT